MNLPPVRLSREEIWRLKLAKAKNFYGHLASWKELFIYQVTCDDMRQVKDIAYLASLEKRGEIVQLPFDEQPIRRYFMRKIIFRLEKIQARKEETYANASKSATS